MSSSRGPLSVAERLGSTALGLALAAGLVAGLFFLLIAPAVERRGEDRARYRWLTTLVSDSESTERQYAEALARHAELEGRIATLTGRLPASADLDGLLAEVSEIARRSEAKLTTFQPLETKLDARPPFQRVRCQFDADWRGMCRLVDRLRRTDALLQIDQVRLATDAQGRLAPTLIDLKLLFLPPGASVVGDDEARASAGDLP